MLHHLAGQEKTILSKMTINFSITTSVYSVTEVHVLPTFSNRWEGTWGSAGTAAMTFLAASLPVRARVFGAVYVETRDVHSL